MPTDTTSRWAVKNLLPALKLVAGILYEDGRNASADTVEAALREIQALTQELTRARKRLVYLRGARSGWYRTAEALRQAVAQARGRVAELSTSLDTAQAQVAQLEEENARLREYYDASRPWRMRTTSTSRRPASVAGSTPGGPTRPPWGGYGMPVRRSKQPPPSDRRRPLYPEKPIMPDQKLAEKKIREKPDRYGAEYHRAMVRVALDFAPRIYPCAECGWPVAEGYCCTTCGSTDPSGKE